MASNFTPQQIEDFLQEFFDVVGARQYIGARYVPIFGRAGEDTVEWDDRAPYEPLTVVMHEGVSYVSRRYVPTNIQIDNTNYWVQTYRFNAQVEQYRQEVLGFQEQIDNRIPYPNPSVYPKYGQLGQVLSTLANGSVRWMDPVVPSDEQAEEVITAWLNAHPEATTTVQDGSVTDAKLYPNGILKRTDNLQKAIHNLDSYIGFYNKNNKPLFTHTGTDIIVSFNVATVNMRILAVSAASGAYGFYNKAYTYTNPITVPSANYLIFDMTSSTFSVVPFADFVATADTVVCFYNSVGNLIGPWSIYEADYNMTVIDGDIDTIEGNITTINANREKDVLFDIDFCSASGFYGEGTIPALTRSGQNIIVAFNKPSNGIRYLSRTAAGNFTLVNKTYEYTDPITVPHNNFLVFNTTTSTFDVVPYADFTQANNILVCFYNASGDVVGDWRIFRFLTMLQTSEDNTAIPAYYDDYLPAKVDTINTHLMAGFDVISFAFLTDLHWVSNAKQSPKLVKYIADRTNLGYVVLNGDYIGEDSTKAIALSEINMVCSLYDGPNWLSYHVCGNHEYNNPGGSHPEHQLTATELEHAILNGTTGMIAHEECSCLVKDPIRNVVFFLMQCGSTSSVSYATQQFFARCLRDSIPQDATVILCAHRLNGLTSIFGIIDAYNARTSATIDGVTFDFTNATGKLVAGFTGHTHADAMTTTVAGVPIFTTTCDAMLELGDLTRTAGTVTEQAFDVVTIDVATKTVDLTRIGAGSDRTYTWS